MADEPSAVQPPQKTDTVKIIELVVAAVFTVAVAAFIVYRILMAGKLPFETTRLEQFQYGLAAICTLVIFSFLYRENPIYRFFEHVLVGLATGYYVGIEIVNVIIPNWWNKMVGAYAAPSDWTWIIFPILGILWYFQLSRNPRLNWYSRVPIFFFMGYGAAMAYKFLINILFGDNGQVVDTFRAVVPVASVGNLDMINNFIYVVICLSVLSYFFFSFKHENNPLLRGSAKSGRYLLMISFGAIFGTTVMGRMSLLIDRLYFLYNDWLKMVQ